MPSKPSLPKPALAVMPPPLAKPIMRRPTLPPLAAPEIDNPMDRVRRTGNPETDHRAAVEAVKQVLPSEKQEIADAARSTHDTMKDANEPRFHFTVVFQTMDERNAFLRAKGWDRYLEDHYRIDGFVVAQVENIKLPPTRQNHHRWRKPTQRLIDMT